MRYTFELLRYALGLRGPLTAVTAAEAALLAEIAAAAVCAVEVGVYEGASSRIILDAMPADGQLFLVDPYFEPVRIERWLGFSGPYWVARRTVAAYSERARFVRMTSAEAAAELVLPRLADLIFIDARHDYESVAEDVRLWSPHLAAGGTLAFHDSRVCAARPELSAQSGPVALVEELVDGAKGDWQLVAAADSLSVLCRRTRKER
jgi:predicted O-methyltransferase YrrM